MSEATETTITAAREKQQAAETLLSIHHVDIESASTSAPGSDIEAESVFRMVFGRQVRHNARGAARGASLNVDLKPSQESFTEEEALNILSTMSVKRKEFQGDIPMERQLEALWNAGLLTADSETQYPEFVVKDEELPQSLRLQGLQQTRAQLFADKIRMAKESERANKSASIGSPPRLAAKWPAMSPTDWKLKPSRTAVSRTDFLRDGVETSTLIDVVSLTQGLIRPDQNGAFRDGHFDSMQKVSMAMKSQDGLAFHAGLPSSKRAGLALAALMSR